MADFKKSHTHYDEKLSYFYYAVPFSIAERVFNWLYVGEYDCPKYGFAYHKSPITGYTEHNPNKCGLIVYASTDEISVWQHNICCINVQAKRMNYYKLTVEEELKLYRLLSMRIWGLKKKLSEYQAEPSLFKQPK